MAYCLLRAGLPQDEIPTGVAIGLAESNGETNALGHVATAVPYDSNYDHGVWQISNKWHPEKLQKHSRWRDPYENAKIVVWIFEEAGNSWKPWNTYGSDAYLKFMTAAKLAALAPFPPQYGWM